MAIASRPDHSPRHATAVLPGYINDDPRGRVSVVRMGIVPREAEQGAVAVPGLLARWPIGLLEIAGPIEASVDLLPGRGVAEDLGVRVSGQPDDLQAAHRVGNARAARVGPVEARALRDAAVAERRLGRGE